MTKLNTHEQWSSRTGFVLAVVGAAVGLGNIWKFPYMTGSNGGGAFVLVYLIAVFLVAIPILMAELILGRLGQHSPPKAMRINAEREGRSAWWSGVGWIGTIVGFLILSFYSVIGGWVLDYMFVSMTQGFTGITGNQAQLRFNALLADPARLTFWFTVFLILTACIVSAGIQKGIERVAGILMPALFFMLVVLMIYSAIFGDFLAGLEFLFVADFSRLDTTVILMAMGQALFSVGISMGLVMAYAAYLPKDISIPRTAVIIASADTLVALMAGLAIFPLVFANALPAGEGPGLIFVTLPIAFGNMTGGGVFGSLFFILLLFAALTSAIGILEPSVAWMEEHRSMNRHISVFIVSLAVWVTGIGSVLSFNIFSEVNVFSKLTFFESIDYLTSNILMPLGGMLIAIFAGWYMRDSTLIAELEMKSPWLFLAWKFLLRTLVPLVILGTLVLNYM